MRTEKGGVAAIPLTGKPVGIFAADIMTDKINTPIEELSLSVRAYNVLKGAGINTVGEITKKTLEELQNIRNMGRHSLEEIVAKVDSNMLLFLQTGIQNHLMSMVHIEKVRDREYCIAMPYFMSDGDSVEIFVKQEQNETYSISDAGDTLNVHVCSWVGKLPNEITEKDFQNMERRLGDFSLDRAGSIIYKKDVTEQELFKEIFRLTHLIVELTEEIR